MTMTATCLLWTDVSVGCGMKRIEHLNIGLELRGLNLNGLPISLPLESFMRVKDLIVEKKLNEIIDMMNVLVELEQKRLVKN